MKSPITKPINQGKHRHQQQPLKQQRHFKKSLQFYQNGEYQKALTIAQRTTYTRYPSHINNLILLSSIHFQLKQWSEAIFYSQQAIRVEANCAEAHCIMGNCLKEMKDTDSAIAFFNKAIRLNPRYYPDAYNNLGLALLVDGELEDAVEAFDVAVAISAASHGGNDHDQNIDDTTLSSKSMRNARCEALSNLGVASKRLGRLNFAKEKYLESVKIDPNCAIAWSNLGGIFADHVDHSNSWSNDGNAEEQRRRTKDHNGGDYGQAIKCYERALNVMPEFADALSNLGNALFKQYHYHMAQKLNGQKPKKGKELEDRDCDEEKEDCQLLIEKIVESYEKALRIRNDFGLCRANYAISLHTFGSSLQKNKELPISTSKKEVRKQLRIAIRQDDTCFDAMNNLAAMYFETSDNKIEAHDIADARLVGLDHREIETSKDGEVEDALKLLLRVVKQKPEHWCAYNNLGNVLQKKGLFAAAALSYKIAQTLNINNALIATNIGAFLVTNQKGNESFRYFQHAMQIDSINPCIYMNMGLAYMSIHRLEDAEKLLKESAYCYGSSAGIACARNGAFEPFYNLAVLEQRKGNLDEALTFIHSAALKCSSELHFQLVDNLLGFLKACMCDWSGCYKTLYVVGILKNQFEKSFDTSAHITAHRETEVICNADIGHDKESLRSSYGISDDLFLFGCFQSPQYICPQLFDVWLNILKETNGTYFLLLRHNEQMEMNLKSEAKRNGVDPNRLIFVNYVSHHEHLKRYSMIDIYLDTFMRSGRVSICETLLSGSPAICIPGESPWTLCGSKILKSVGLDGMIVQSLEEYRNLAISLQSDQEKFIEIIRKLDEKVGVADSNFPKCRWVYCIEKGLQQS